MLVLCVGFLCCVIVFVFYVGMSVFALRAVFFVAVRDGMVHVLYWCSVLVFCVRFSMRVPRLSFLC